MRKLLIACAVVGFVFAVSGIVQAASDCVFVNDDVAKTMVLQGNCTTDATIVVLDDYTLDGNGYGITAEDPTSGHFTGGVVENGGSVANVINLTIDTDNLANVCDSGADRLRGILFTAASGSIVGNTVDNVNQGSSGCQEGNAIEVRNAPFDGTHPNTQFVIISGNSVSNYQKGGIIVNGDVDATIHQNTIVGIGRTDNIAQNGIQLGYGATASVKKNTVNADWYNGEDWASTGILIYETDDVTVQGNTLADNEVGVYIAAYGWSAPGSNGNKVIRNTIAGSSTAVAIDGRPIWGPHPATAENNKVANNTLSCNSELEDEGVWIGEGADNNKVIHNMIDDSCTTAITTGFDDNTKVHANVIEP